MSSSPIRTATCRRNGYGRLQDDVVIRAFRNTALICQRKFHKDMAGNFEVYPQEMESSRTPTQILTITAFWNLGEHFSSAKEKP